jgi:hypothetical protein
MLFTACSQDQLSQRGLIQPRDGRAAAVIPGTHEWPLNDANPDTINGAVWNPSEAFQTGTGNLDPFLQIQNSPAEEGFNTDVSGVLDDKNSANFNHSLPLNHIPVIRKQGVSYRELILDANEANSLPDAQFSIDKFNVWLCNDANAGAYDTRSDFESNSACALVYGLTHSGQPDTLLASDASSRGSGNQFDYQILIPDAAFLAAAGAVGVNANTDCGYNGNTSAPCGSYVVVDTKMGYKGGDWVTGSTFEELSTVVRPWVTVTKTAVPSFTRRYNWQIQKSVNPTDIYLFDGQSQNATWTVTVTPGSPPFTDSNIQLAGSVTVSNTSGSTVTIDAITDQLSNSLGSVTLTCPNGTGPVTLANNATYVCTYTKTFATTPTGAQSNTATVTIEAGAGLDPSVFTGSAQFNFANATPTEIDKNPPVYDNYNGAGETLLGNASGSPFTYTKTYTCGSTHDESNVARVDLTGVTDPTASATEHLHCLTLTISKTAATSKTRTYQWQIAKSAQPDSWTLFNGDNGTTKYTITVQPAATPFVDADNHVSGSITIHNPNSVSVFIQSVADVISGANAPSVTPNCGVSFPYTLTAGSDLICSYAADLPDGTLRTNTASTVAKPTAAGTNKTFTSVAVNVDPSQATLTEVNKTVHVTDNFDGGGAVAQGTVTSPNTGTFNPTHQFSCPTGKASYTNVATITETSQTANKTVTVACRDYTVTKTAATTWRRSWTWGVTKTINPTSTSLTLDLNQQYIVGYTVTYTQNAPTDDLFRVGGTVTITNPASGGPAATTTATINSASDVITAAALSDVPVTLSCGVSFPTTIVAGGSLSCTYSNVALSDKSARTNTATAVRQNHNFDFQLAATNGSTTSRNGTAAVTFASSPTTAVDQCINAADSNPGTSVATGPWCANKTFTYNKTLQYASCGVFTVPNTASFTTVAGTAGTGTNSATPLTGSASVTITVTVPCPQGCTLTQDASFKGGAPLDDNWNNIVSLKELTGFFTTWSPSYPVAGPNTPTDFNWFNVFWTAPKGNTYYQLAHQYEAAKLNYLNNAGQVPSVTAAILAAETFFSTAGNTPDGWTSGSTTKAQLLGWASTLGSYNEGTIGPGHCSEDNTSSIAP